MPKLLLPNSPCQFCSHLIIMNGTFVFEGGVKFTEMESCSVVSNTTQFHKHRHGVETEGETRFPWCSYLKRRVG